MTKRNKTKNAVCRLCENKDFSLWLGFILDQLCAYEQGLGRLDDFTQGKRAAATFIVHSLREGGDAARDMMAKIYTEYFGKLMTKPNQEVYK